MDLKSFFFSRRISKRVQLENGCGNDGGQKVRVRKKKTPQIFIPLLFVVYKIRRGPKLEDCAFDNFGNSSGTEGNRVMK